MNQIVHFLKTNTLFPLLLVVALHFSNSAQAAGNSEVSYNLVLAGGGLKTCASMSLSSCKTDSFSESAKRANQFHFSSDSVDRFKQSQVFKKQNEIIKSRFNTILEHFYASPITISGGVREIAQEFEKHAAGFSGIDFVYDLPNDIYYALQDFFETANERREEVNLRENKSTKVAQIYMDFVTQANLKRAPSDEQLRIGVLTSSSRDAFASADFYQAAFENAAKLAVPNVKVIVEWIPLDESLSYAIQMQQKGFDLCDQLDSLKAQRLVFNRHVAYPVKAKLQTDICKKPDSLIVTFQSLHGLFINGGDQSKTLNTLVTHDGKDTRWLSIVKTKLHQGTLILGGTSAGTAVQAGGIFNYRQIPMISSGDSEVAFIRGGFALPPPPFGCEKDKNCPHGLLEDDLTFNPRGGLGTFTLGITDTHFSERDREARLALLNMQTKTRFGFGVDEATALFVAQGKNDTQMKIVGEGGVFITDVQNGIFKTQAGKNQVVGLSHYLTDGDNILFDAQTQEMLFTFSPGKQKVVEPTSIKAPEKGEWRKQVYLHCGTTSFHRWSDMKIAFLVNPSQETQFFATSNNPKHCSYVNLLFGMEN
ncbi:MAG: hypothetical protein GJ680_15250 [Alteromonadaceae bacterium]|nr:hypothetical protein [Alteromonadaceae bacterium]